MRKGFSIPELLVALVLLNAGLLVLVALSAATIRMATDAQARSAAVAAGSNRAEWLAAAPCGGSASGTAAAPRGVREHWWVVESEAAPGAARRREIVDSVTYPMAGRGRHLVFRTHVPC